MIVVSTGFRAPTKGACLASVREQVGVVATHIYVEASEQSPPRDVITNLADALRPLDPREIVAWVDGDDWLARPDALSIVERAHEAGAWVTWGSFQYADGREGFAADFLPGDDVRKVTWRTTHLKTFRAGLFQRLRLEELIWAEGAPVPWDMVVMMAALEMAGWDRARFITEILYTYNYGNSHEWRSDAAGRIAEIRLAAQVRSFTPYPRVETL